MRLHEREMQVNQAKTQLALVLHQKQEELDLTDIEMLQALHEYMQGTLKYMLRWERHEDYDKPAGLA